MVAMVSIFICVPGEPVGKGRPRIGRHGQHAMMFTPQKTADYESAVRAEAAASMRGEKPLTGPLELKLQLFLGIPKGHSKKRAEACRRGLEVPTKTPDWDNCAKAVCDAFNGVVWEDDKQVVDAFVTKRYADEPCIIAIVTPLKLGPVDLLDGQG